MQINRTSLALLSIARACGLSSCLRGWNRGLTFLLPIEDQCSELIATTYRGYPYYAAPTHFVDWQVLVVGGYELDDIKVFERIAKKLKRATVLDVGTNVGHHAFVFATLGWQVHAFEPNPALWPLVEAKTHGAGLSEITLHKVGLGDGDDILSFCVPVATNSGTGYFTPGGSVQAGNEQRLPVKQGDSYLASQGIGKVDIIKIDIQGFEPQALRGLRLTLLRDRPIVSVEVGEENQETIPDLDALRDFLPPSYVFWAFQYKTGMLSRRAFWVEINGDDFRTFRGNLFCAPEDKLNLIEPD